MPTKNSTVLLAPYSAEYGAIFSSILRRGTEIFRSVSAPKLYHAQVHLSRVFSVFAPDPRPWQVCARSAPSGQIEGKFHKILKIPGISKFFQAVPNGFYLRRYRKFYQLLTHRNYRKNVDAAIVQVVILSGKIYRNV